MIGVDALGQCDRWVQLATVVLTAGLVQRHLDVTWEDVDRVVTAIRFLFQHVRRHQQPLVQPPNVDVVHSASQGDVSGFQRSLSGLGTGGR
ncbi:hypothetical protein D3C73_1541560 [compost metagenome]